MLAAVAFGAAAAVARRRRAGRARGLRRARRSWPAAGLAAIVVAAVPRARRPVERPRRPRGARPARASARAQPLGAAVPRVLRAPDPRRDAAVHQPARRSTWARCRCCWRSSPCCARPVSGSLCVAGAGVVAAGVMLRRLSVLRAGRPHAGARPTLLQRGAVFVCLALALLAGWGLDDVLSRLPAPPRRRPARTAGWRPALALIVLVPAVVVAVHNHARRVVPRRRGRPGAGAEDRRRGWPTWARCCRPLRRSRGCCSPGSARR